MNRQCFWKSFMAMGIWGCMLFFSNILVWSASANQSVPPESLYTDPLNQMTQTDSMPSSDGIFIGTDPQTGNKVVRVRPQRTPQPQTWSPYIEPEIHMPYYPPPGGSIYPPNTLYPPSVYPPSVYPPSVYPPSVYPPSVYPPSVYPPSRPYPPQVRPPHPTPPSRPWVYQPNPDHAPALIPAYPAQPSISPPPTPRPAPGSF